MTDLKYFLKFSLVDYDSWFVRCMTNTSTLCFHQTLLPWCVCWPLLLASRHLSLRLPSSTSTISSVSRSSIRPCVCGPHSFDIVIFLIVSSIGLCSRGLNPVRTHWPLRVQPHCSSFELQHGAWCNLPLWRHHEGWDPNSSARAKVTVSCDWRTALEHCIIVSKYVFTRDVILLGVCCHRSDYDSFDLNAVVWVVIFCCVFLAS